MFTKLSSVSHTPVSITELNRQVRDLLESSFPVMWVTGEISNFKRYGSGHCYFSLKDANAQVRCVMFRNRAALIDFEPREGLLVEARVVITLYEARGDFQLTVEAMRPAGLGGLFEAFEALKKKLAGEGLFDPARKRPLPAFPRALGIVTSPKAAALRDVLTTLARRMPGLPVMIYPTAVQGAAAAAEIAAAIRLAGERGEVDTLLVCRGGGSLEDLWSFNEEIVARAIAACPIPVVAGVGHETDFTIADFVADVRAPTPTAAAELASPNRAEWRNRIDALAHRLQRDLTRALQLRMQRLDTLARRLRHPGERLAMQRERVAMLGRRLLEHRTRRLTRKQDSLSRLRLKLAYVRPDLPTERARLDALGARLATSLRQTGERQRARLAQLDARLGALNPEAVLARGYALVERPRGDVVTQAAQLRAGDALRLRFADGAVDAEVKVGDGEQGALF
ncbi:exodeoxyribonuclease VII large subunit [Chitiniphilus eburneus]|uniref:Exodeoxyribonuclease 7 large subunit n=1 Tax=Chitiniphilus eburneus TaxID=2571148 RepID=A0A4U0Q3J4_9NEIS|nr:exodeoxyribonuclease VII large subunit [Chitiniphilus eburneus]TJZ75545.1 exodeoxyribonuclease VII large subunit [Chitiniphilus eburneus]